MSHQKSTTILYFRTTKKCPECDGMGQVDYDEAVIDFVNGGYYRQRIETCPLCEGYGEVDE